MTFSLNWWLHRRLHLSQVRMLNSFSVPWKVQDGEYHFKRILSCSSFHVVTNEELFIIGELLKIVSVTLLFLLLLNSKVSCRFLWVTSNASVKWLQLVSDLKGFKGPINVFSFPSPHHSNVLNDRHFTCEDCDGTVSGGFDAASSQVSYQFLTGDEQPFAASKPFRYQM